MNARQRIAEWFDRLNQGAKMSKEDVCFLMVQIRHLIETSSTRSNYRIASFYADWTVHSALDRSPVCFEILRDITRVLVESWAVTSADMPGKISGIIGLPKLRAELTTLFSEYQLPLAVFEYYENWKYFGAFLLWHIEGQPITWPSEPRKAATAIRAEMLALPRPNNIASEALVIFRHEATYKWRLELSGDKAISIVGGLDSLEEPAAFRLPPRWL